jgi:hypothetical protein
VIPAKGPSRDRYVAKLRKICTCQPMHLLVDVIEELFALSDNAVSIDDRAKVLKQFRETVATMGSAAKIQEALDIAEMKAHVMARQKQANDLDKLH